MKKQLKLAVFALTVLIAGVANAQQTSGNIGKKNNADLGTADRAVKVIDNKGTIKYLQSANGITSFTDTAPDGGEVTTWQLGGTLNATTTITAGTQNFTIDGVGFALQNVGTTTATAATTTTAVSNASNPAGWTVLVRDEQTGRIQKVLAADLLKVNAIRTEFIQPNGTNVTSTSTANQIVTVTELPAITGPTDPKAFKLFVFRNGAKLRIGTDFTATTAGQIEIDRSQLPVYQEDVIEVQYIK